MSSRQSQSISSKQASFIKKALEPITEESIASSIDGKSRSKQSSSGRSPLGYPPTPVRSQRTSKACPTTGGICPSKAAMAPSTQTSRSYMSDWSSLYDESRKSYNSLLVKPFIFRRASSLQEAVAANDKKLAELFLNKMAIDTTVEEAQTRPSTCQRSSTPASTSSERYVDSKSQTDVSDITSHTESTKKTLNYLMGISDAREEQDEEQQESSEDVEKVLIDDREDVCGETEAMKQAQRYLRVHRIFEFYQFLVAHLLSAVPVALFNLMDRMRTGYIEKEQYVVGMKTLGICSYNNEPPTSEGMIHKDFFVEEA
ncbi:ef-hand calcium-binding domain-containing protein 10 [Holotrichia oblita]|uniref:Ef-hand calcium-binding domain-containing protein 10 n=1 Tax=Holotrichia oblita TaxID=644536 RepID=A0ACB9TU86_HOLOL|nr:ef-hand calcium-binding domain-containing protein 10 [Holotrichia oblita]